MTNNRPEFSSMDEIFRRLMGSNFLELAGLNVDASIPVPEHIVNEMIEAALQGNRSITDCHVSIHEQNRVIVYIKTPLWPWPLNFKLRLERSVELRGSPRVRALLENNVLLGKLGPLFRALPDGISIEGEYVVVDVQSFLSTAEQKRLLELIKSAEISTEETKLILNVKIKVG